MGATIMMLSCGVMTSNLNNEPMADLYISRILSTEQQQASEEPRKKNDTPHLFERERESKFAASEEGIQVVEEGPRYLPDTDSSAAAILQWALNWLTTNNMPDVRPCQRVFVTCCVLLCRIVSAAFSAAM